MNFWDAFTEFGPFPREKSCSWTMLREKATANTEDVEKTWKSEQRQQIFVLPWCNRADGRSQTCLRVASQWKKHSSSEYNHTCSSLNKVEDLIT